MDARTFRLVPALLALGLASGFSPVAQAAPAPGALVEQADRMERQAGIVAMDGIGATHASTRQGRYGTLISGPATGRAASADAPPSRGMMPAAHHSQQSALRDGVALFWAARQPTGGHGSFNAFPPALDLVLCAGLTSGYYALARFTCRNGGIESAAFRGCGFVGTSVTCAAP